MSEVMVSAIAMITGYCSLSTGSNKLMSKSRKQPCCDANGRRIILGRPVSITRIHFGA